MEDAFPKAVLAGDDAHALAALGPPARVYDTVTATPEAATLFEHDVEVAWAKKVAHPAPDSLRRWAHFMLTASETGTVPEELGWFAAEHVGLPGIPYVVNRFVVGEDAHEAVKLLGDTDLGDDVSSVAVATEKWEGGYRGVVVALAGVADFEPFPRVWAAGDIASVPGATLRKDRTYALYVCGEGAKVDVYSLPEKGGRFDLDVPLPAAPGAYRVALSAFKREGFPDSAFFFTFYVGQEPPSVPTPLPAVPETEDAVLAGLNDVRVRYGLPTLAPVGDRDRLRAFLDGLPKGEVAQVRAMRAFSRTDPLPEQPHGLWHGMGATTTSAARALWVMEQSPVNRKALLAPETRFVLLAGDPDERSTYWMGLTFEAAPAAAAVRTAVADSIAARFQRPPARSATLDEALGHIAERVATGETNLSGAMREVDKLVRAQQKAGRLVGAAAMNAFTWAPGGPPSQVESFAPDPRFGALGVGVASGDMGRKGGIQYLFALVVCADGLTLGEIPPPPK